MSNLTLTEAFAKYGATLSNPRFAFSAIAKDGAFVMSCWQHKFSKPEKGVLRYTDCLSRWKRQTAGKNLFETHLREAHEKRLTVRLVIASTQDTAVVDAGEDASKSRNWFFVREDMVGQIVSFDEDTYVIDFKKTGQTTATGV